MPDTITDQYTLTATIRERRALEHLHRLLVAARRQAEHSDLDGVDTPDLTDPIAEVITAMEEREMSIRRYEGEDPAASRPPRNRNGARC